MLIVTAFLKVLFDMYFAPRLTLWAVFILECENGGKYNSVCCGRLISLDLYDGDGYDMYMVYYFHKTDKHRAAAGKQTPNLGAN